jgi:hypothetical protein
MWLCHCYQREETENFKGSIVVQAVRPVFNTTYESPLLNLQDQRFLLNMLKTKTLFSTKDSFPEKPY